MNNLEIYEKVRAVPQEAKKPIKGGRLSGMTDINPMWRIKVLTEQFGPCGFGWYYKVLDKWLETCGNEIVAFVDIELFINIDGEWSKSIAGTGGSKFATTEKNGVFVSDECYKMATTDAISVACKQLGIGADVYWDKDNTKYSNGGKKTQENEPDKTDISEDTKRIIIELAEEYAQMNVGTTKEQILNIVKAKIPFDLETINSATAQKVVAQLELWITKTKQKRGK